MSESSLAMGFALAATAGATMALLGIASHSRFAGIADDPAGAPDRKLQSHPVPSIGGAALLVGLLAASAASGSMVPDVSIWPAIALAFAVGFVDDRTPGGQPAERILLGQSIVAAVLVAGGWRLWEGESPLLVLASFLAAIAAMNAANTFDNADGAATSLGILALSAGAPLLAAPLLGFLPFNLWLRRGQAPLAYLGNSGSHLLGVLLLVDPIARIALLLPLLDLARLVVVRRRAGSPPWRGDRRHLAHRLQTAGLPPTLVVIVLLAIAAPSILGARAAASEVSNESGSALPIVLGVALTSAAFAIAILRTPPPG